MDRAKLIKDYEEAGATKEAMQDFKTLSPQKMEVELADQQEIFDKYVLNKQKYLSLSKKEYTRLCKEYDILEDDSDDRNNWFSLDQAVENQKFRSKMSNSISNFRSSEENELSVADARYRLEKLGKNISLEDVETTNLRIYLSNIIKREFGIPEQPQILTDLDLETILSLDSWEIGKSCYAFLSAQKPVLKDSYKGRMQDILLLRSANIEANKREQIKIRKIEHTYDKYKVSPTKIIRRSDGRIEVNKDYVDFCEGIKKFQNELIFLSKSYQEKDIPFQEIVDKVNETIKRHKL